VDAVLWLVAGAVLVVVELLTLAVVAGFLGAGALVTALVAALGAPPVVQGVVFVGVSGALLGVAREPVQRRLGRGSSSPSADPRALTGSTAVVVERVSETTGQVRLHGELWRARPYAGTGPVEAGAPVSVAAVEGATLLVYSPDLV